MEESKSKELTKQPSTAVALPMSGMITTATLTLLENLSEHIAKSKKYGELEASDALAAMILGNEMGLTPMASCLLGKKLNANSYFAVLRGRELGLDPVTSISKVYVIPTSNGDVLSLAVDIIIAKILESGTIFNYIRDNEPTPTYKSMEGKYIGHRWLISDEAGNIKPQFYLFIKDVSTKADLDGAKRAGKIIIFQSGITNVTSVNFVRKSHSIEMVVHYSIQEAIDAGLFNGFHSVNIDAAGKPLWIKGKSNWNNHPATHLRHRPMAIGGRIVVADILAGSYLPQEVIEILDKDEVQNENDLVDYQYAQAEVIVEEKNESTEEK